LAKYIPSYVDTSGLSQGISRGLEIAAANREKQDQLAEARVNDFMKTYRPDKLRDNDIPDFTSDFNSYKEAALLYSRFNRGGAKPEQLAAAKVNMDKALGNLNSTYSNSATASNKLAEYANYINTAKQKGYQIPEEVTTNYNALATTGIKNIDVAKIPSAFTFDLVPREIDYEGINKLLDSTDAKLKDITTIRETVPYGKDINGNVIYTYADTKYSGRDPASTVDMIKKIGKSKGDIQNAAIQSRNNLLDGLSKNSREAQAQFDEIKKSFTFVQSMDDVTPEMVFALPMYMQRSQGRVIDDSYGKQQYQRALDLAKINLQRQKIASGSGEPGGTGVDIFGNIDKLAAEGVQTSITPLDLSTQEIIVKSVSGTKPEYNISNDDVYIKKENGVINVYSSKDIKSKSAYMPRTFPANTLIGPLDRTSVNLLGNSGLGTKVKNTIVSNAGAQGNTEEARKLLAEFAAAEAAKNNPTGKKPKGK
jgi:hypothetical protein